MSWLQPPITLRGNKVRLEPLATEHFNELLTIASANEQIWTHLPVYGVNGDLLLAELKSALTKRASGEQYPFVIIDSVNNKVIGSTRFLNIFPEHRKLEIGWTWYDPAYWGTGYNIECKYMLLTHSFEALNCIRVQLQASEKNERSRAAIQKIGGKFEGVLRNDRVRPDGTLRNTAVYSIIDTEWPEVKKMLKEKMG
jgi:RimJ/RimL family protein N-acetyltransferase